MRLSPLTKAWFNLPDDPDKARFEIKHLLSGELSKIKDKARIEAVELLRSNQGDLEQKMTVTLRQEIGEELTVCAAITNWENVFDSEGKPLDCDEQGKVRLCRELSEDDWNSFLKFIADSRKILADQMKKEKKEALGN